MLPVTKEELWQQAASQVNPIEALSAAEGQTDLNAYALINLIQDVKNYGGTGPITLSAKTCNALAALQTVAASSSLKDADVTTPATSSQLQITISFKQSIRALQTAYYTLKAKLGLS